MAGTSDPMILGNAIALGSFPTKMMVRLFDEKGEEVAEANPLQRIGSPDGIAGALIFLLPRASSFLTCAVILLDRGLSTTMSVGLTT